MESCEFQEERRMMYDSLVAYLAAKYGRPNENYFIKENCKSKNRRIFRSSEGLICHHVGEFEYSNISEPWLAKLVSFDYQMPHNLVYCNLIEHLLLHIKIWQETEVTIDMNSKNFFKSVRRTEPRSISFDMSSAYNMRRLLPISGGFDFITTDCNELYAGKGLDKPHRLHLLEQIEGNIDDYADVLAELVQNCVDHFTGKKENNVKEYSVGDMFIHPQRGNGRIVEINGQSDESDALADYVIRFEDGESLRIGRMALDKGDYNLEIDRIIDNLSKDYSGTICPAVRDAIDLKVKR